MIFDIQVIGTADIDHLIVVVSFGQGIFAVRVVATQSEKLAGSDFDHIRQFIGVERLRNLGGVAGVKHERHLAIAVTGKRRRADRHRGEHHRMAILRNREPPTVPGNAEIHGLNHLAAGVKADDKLLRNH
ncbi:hypothetical protein SDC9_180781 [bioreactor metagenome]|uniref:Uncharacterized protein n=1 Tax=bioreactor metagenome TaxID=1076179 RepID=A0A645H481_9ZZZZ